MNQPTEAQIKEFWEWCGHFRWADTPIDLNNLFKYAVPKFLHKLISPIEFYRHPSKDRWVCDFVVNIPNIRHILATDKDPALALFWAIWEVLHQSAQAENQTSNDSTQDNTSSSH